MLDAVRSSLPQPLSPWGMFLAADIIVQWVMVGLVLAALLTWVVWGVKALELRASAEEVRHALRMLQQHASLAALSSREDLLGVMVGIALEEQQASAGLSAAGVQMRTAASLGRAQAAVGRRINRGTGILATIGSTAPFIGLFGTVWGIMNSFISISRAQTTNLAVVAPGIAEALLATALGLFAAIPAVIIYNALARSIAGYRALVADVTTAVLNRQGRELESRA